jgi:Uma2 family endonuclease
MATTTADTTTAPDADQCVVMWGVGWKGYTAVLRARGERSRPKLIYLDGDLLLMSTAYQHEFLKKRLGEFVHEVIVGLRIPCTPAGATTFRRRKKQAGAEGDESFYLANEPRIRGKQRQNLSLRRDPPPDLVIEAVNTHEADEAVEVWRRFGVPEVWVCDVDALQILSLQPDGRYAEVPNSRAFPFLTAAEIFGWVSRAHDGPETEWIAQVRAWVRDVLAPRVRGGA